MSIKLFLVAQGFKRGFDGEGHDAGRTVGKMMLESILVNGHFFK
jgi:hypothetical protein